MFRFLFLFRMLLYSSCVAAHESLEAKSTGACCHAPDQESLTGKTYMERST